MDLRVTFDHQVDKLESMLTVLELENDNRFKEGVPVQYQNLDGLLARFELDGVPGEYPEFEPFIHKLMERRGFSKEAVEVIVTPDRDYWE